LQSKIYILAITVSVC